MGFANPFHLSRAGKALRTLTLLLPLAIVCGCGGRKTDTFRESIAGDDETVPLPNGLSPTALFTTNSSSLLIKAAGNVHYRALYSWESRGTPTFIVGGRDLDVKRLSNDTFAAWYSEQGHEEIVTLDGQKLISQPLTLPTGGPTGWGACEGDSQYVVCIGDPPGTSVEDKDYDEMGFSAVLLVSLAQRKATWFPVKHRTHIRFDREHKMIYVIDWLAPSSHGLVEAFDLTGTDRGSAPLKDVMPLSPSGRFIESLAEDGSESWEVYDAESMKLLLAFNCDRPECKEGDPDEHQWNPKFKDQVVAVRSGGAYGKGGACDVYQLSPPHLMKTVPCGGLPAYDWTRDGRELVTLQYEGNIFRREPVN